MLVILQAEFDILGQILNVGGILSFALAVGLFTLWNEYKATKRALADLNEVVRKDAIANIKIIDTLTASINSHSDNSDRTLNAVTEILAIRKARAEAQVR